MLVHFYVFYLYFFFLPQYLSPSPRQSKVTESRCHPLPEYCLTPHQVPTAFSFKRLQDHLPIMTKVRAHSVCVCISAHVCPSAYQSAD